VNKCEILLVDDDPHVLTLITRTLENQGYQITSKPSGEAAVDELSRKDFDLVITDFEMDGTDGLAVLRKARERNPQARVILSTGHIISRVFALSLGFDDYIPKPSSLGELLTGVAKCLEKLE